MDELARTECESVGPELRGSIGRRHLLKGATSLDQERGVASPRFRWEGEQERRRHRWKGWRERKVPGQPGSSDSTAVVSCEGSESRNDTVGHFRGGLGAVVIDRCKSSSFWGRRGLSYFRSFCVPRRNTTGRGHGHFRPGGRMYRLQVRRRCGHQNYEGRSPLLRIGVD